MTEVVLVDGVCRPMPRAGKDKSYYEDIRADELGALWVEGRGVLEQV
jgi:hypothetical protein